MATAIISIIAAGGTLMVSVLIAGAVVIMALTEFIKTLFF